MNRELRIGNYINTHSPEKVVDVMCDCVNTMSGTYTLDLISPIELTSHVMSRIKGVQILDDSVNPQLRLIINEPLAIYLVANVSPAYLWLDNQYSKMCLSPHPVKYLHQLQNLYYSLTGKELEVEL